MSKYYIYLGFKDKKNCFILLGYTSELANLNKNVILNYNTIDYDGEIIVKSSSMKKLNDKLHYVNVKNILQYSNLYNDINKLFEDKSLTKLYNKECILMFCKNNTEETKTPYEINGLYLSKYLFDVNTTDIIQKWYIPIDICGNIVKSGDVLKSGECSITVIGFLAGNNNKIQFSYKGNDKLVKISGLLVKNFKKENEMLDKYKNILQIGDTVECTTYGTKNIGKIIGFIYKSGDYYVNVKKIENNFSSNWSQPVKNCEKINILSKAL